VTAGSDEMRHKTRHSVREHGIQTPRMAGQFTAENGECGGWLTRLSLLLLLPTMSALARPKIPETAPNAGAVFSGFTNTED